MLRALVADFHGNSIVATDFNPALDYVFSLINS